jgi:hypothetical protein
LIIDICVTYTNTQSLKDSVSHFRNVCQHSSHALLESGFKYLVKENKKQLDALENEQGLESLQKIVSDFYEKAGVDAVVQEVDATPEELILLASCEMDMIEKKYEIFPKINFYTEVCKIILDTLRHNWRTLEIYN